MFFYRRKTLYSDLLPEVALNLLRKNIVAFSWQRAAFWEEQQGLFHGEVVANRFFLTLAVKGSRSFAPHISGVVDVSDCGSKIRLVMRLKNSVVFVVVCFLAAMVLSTLREPQWLSEGGALPLLFVAAFMIAGVMAFRREVRAAETVLEELLVKVK